MIASQCQIWDSLYLAEKDVSRYNCEMGAAELAMARLKDVDSSLLLSSLVKRDIHFYIELDLSRKVSAASIYSKRFFRPLSTPL